MTKFQVARELDGLSDYAVAIGLEDHNGDGSSGNDIASNELSQDIESHLLVGDGKEDADGKDEDQGDNEGEDVGPKWHLCVVNFDGNCSEDEGNDKNDSEPPVRDVTVTRHEARVNILLILDAVTELLHNVTSVPQVGVSNDCSESGKAQGIADSERR